MRRFLFLLLMAASGAWATPRVTADTDRVVLGRDREVHLALSEPTPLAWSVSEGELRQDGPDRLVWHAPDSGSPRTALLLIWDPSEETPHPVVLRIPLIGRTDLEIDTERRAKVTVEVAGRSFGPRTANERGRVRVPVEVPPGADVALVHAEAEGRRTERRVALGLPPETRVLAALTPHPLSAGTGGFLMVTGIPPLSPEALELKVHHARTQATEVGDPLLYAITPDAGATEVTVSAERKGLPQSRVMTAAAVSETGPRPSSASGPSAPLALQVGAGLGGFLGAGAAKGFSAELLAGWTPGWLDRKLQLELSVGWRHTGWSGPFGDLGTQHSAINVVPLLVSARYLALQTGPWQVGAQLGVGVAPWDHRLSSDFDGSFREGGVTFALDAGLDAAFVHGRWAPFLAVGYGFLPRLKTPQVSAQLSGPRAVLGVRYAIP